MPRSRSRSRSPRMEERRRSRSPDGDRDRPRKIHSGFRWKDTKRRDDSRYADDDRRLERGYRDRDRPRSPRRDRDGDRYGDRYRDGARDRRRDDREGRPLHDRERHRDEDRKPKPKEKKPAATQPSEPMIVVHVNDRLGTKAAIPCLPSDPISECTKRQRHLSRDGAMLIVSILGLFKAQVAARIGREPHEILLKRQGERPFKDQLTLEDYGISNGVQLDL